MNHARLPAGIAALLALIGCSREERDLAERAALHAETRCVDAGRFRVTPDVACDTREGGLCWQRRVEARLPQADAERYCDALTLGGQRGWRLPTTHELSGIRYKPGGLFGGGPDAPYCIPSIDQAAFPGTPAGLFWTSVTAPDGTAWYVGFDDGRAHRDLVTDELWVRCVHDP